MSQKRKDYINWNEYFMGVALLSAQRSKDPNTQVGCCIASQDNIILSVGYNGLPRGCSDDEFPWGREGKLIETKYPYVVHAELNAILNSGGRDLRGGKLYVVLHPCQECAKAIIQAGIREVYYLSDKYADLDETKISKRMLETAGVKSTHMTDYPKQIILDFEKKI
ncbi:MAG: dCMP deaminase family protein [Clostridia bacterium]|nr:dCMP deaminase family protein [Clostridia bacterium]